jgi:flagellar basal-body rod modification protein FlgD
MEVTGATQPNVQGPATTSNDTRLATESITSDFETFLQLLTAQMKNQDPTKPIDSTEFVGQLASFSAVEQQIATNTKLDELIGSLSLGGANGLAQWLGADIRAARVAEFSGDPIDLQYQMPQDATAAMISVTDENGNQVDSFAVPAGSSRATWDGLTAEGNPAELGNYRFTLQSAENGTPLDPVSIAVYANVVEARLEAGQTLLTLADGTTLNAGDVTDMRVHSTAETA